MKKRVFVAIDFPKAVKEEIGATLEELRRKYPEIRWEKEENLHLTLKFLGWTEKEGEIISRIGKATQGVQPFWLQPTKIGHFLRESLIVWLGLEIGEELLRLVGNLEKEMERAGFCKEKREFTPHITLGRLRYAHPASKWRQILTEMEMLKTPEFIKFQVKEIVLMESKLSRQGSTYQILKRAPLVS